MSQLQNQKTELETLRDQWRTHNAANPNDAAGAATLREVENQLATVNTRIIRGPGADAFIGAARGRAAIAAHRNPTRAKPTLPTPAPMPTADPQARRFSFQDKSDVPMPAQSRSRDAQVVRQNGRAEAGQPQAPAASSRPPADVPSGAPEADTRTAAPRYSWQSENDVPMPTQTRSVAEQTMRANGRR